MAIMLNNQMVPILDPLPITLEFFPRLPAKFGLGFPLPLQPTLAVPWFHGSPSMENG